MATIDLSDDSLRRLEALASQTDCTPDEMLVRLLDATSEPVMDGAVIGGEQTYLNEILHTIVDNIPVMLTFFDDAGRLLFVNRYELEQIGWTLSEMQAQDALMLVLPDPVERQEVIDYMLSGEQTWREQTLHTKYGSTLDTAWMNIILPDGRGIGIGRDITVEKQIEEVTLQNALLKERFNKEQEHNALVQKLIVTLSHDLRIPLSVIGTSKEILRHYADTISPETRLEKLDKIGRQLEYAINLLDDTVTLVRDRLNAPLAPAPINIANLCQVSVQEVSIAFNHSHRLNFVNHGVIGQFMASEILISRILMNLLSNAIKYSPSGSQVWLELDRDDSNIILRVRDEGFGISSEHLPHIFEPFYRVKERPEIRGTGLGLSIVKDCVERHQGHISVESDVGQGTTITIALPTLSAEAVV